jgi:hypothetical protein
MAMSELIKFEHNMLVLNNSFDKDDVEHINNFTDFIRKQEQDRFTQLLETEQQRTKLGFIQYKRIQELLNG